MEKMEWKIIMFIVATNAVASQPPKRRLTETLHALAFSLKQEVIAKYLFVFASQIFIFQTYFICRISFLSLFT